jgi:hypothetical protein
MGNAHVVLVGKHQENDPRVRPRRRWWDHTYNVTQRRVLATIVAVEKQ